MCSTRLRRKYFSRVLYSDIRGHLTRFFFKVRSSGVWFHIHWKLLKARRILVCVQMSNVSFYALQIVTFVSLSINHKQTRCEEDCLLGKMSLCCGKCVQASCNV